MIIVNYRVNQRAPRLIIPSLPIYAIPSSCLPIHPRDIPSPTLHFNPFYTPFHRPTFHFLRSFRLVRWPRIRTKQCFHVSMKRDSRRWVESLDNNFNRPLKKKEKEKKGKKKREMSRRSISHTHHTTHRSRLIFLRLPSPPIFQKNGNRNRSTEATFSLARKLDKTFSKGRKIEISNSQV